MLSKYFVVKTNSKGFCEYLEELISELKDKRVIIYGAGDGFVELDKKFDFKSRLNIVALADLKFDKQQTYRGYNAIAPKSIEETEFDYILVTNEAHNRITNFLINNLKIDENKIKLIFKEEVQEEVTNIEYLESFRFSKTLLKLKKKLKNKTILIYGAGLFLEVIKAYYDLSGLNIIGISDKRFSEHKENESFLGYKVYSPNEIVELNPDCVLVATKKYVNIMEFLYFELLKGTKIDVKPLLKKDIWTLIGEIWS